MKAWKAEFPMDEEGRSKIVFAFDRADAKKQAMCYTDEIGEGDWTELHVVRAKEFDHLEDEDDLLRAQLAAGWWFTCAGCDKCITSYETEEEDEDGNPVPPNYRYVWRAGTLWCSSACCIKYLREQRQYLVNEWEVVGEAVWRWPGIEIIWSSGHTCVRKPPYTTVGSVDFRFPGGKGRVSWVRGDETVMVEQQDAEAWRVFSDKCKALRLTQPPQESAAP